MSATAINTIVGIVGIIVGIIGTLVTIFAISKKKTITITKKSRLYCSIEKKGSFTFDYSDNNGEYIIGSGEKLFRTRWSKASDTSIYAYKDGNGMCAIALLKNVGNIEDMKNIEGDFSSRCRSPRVGDAIVWQNMYGNYAITKVVDIKDDSRKDAHDELTCDYIILD